MKKEKFLITGFSGFVSRHFLNYLETNEIVSEVIGIDIAETDLNLAPFKFITCSFQKINLLNKEEVEKVIAEFKPDYVLHLASNSSVAMSWKKPVESFTNNTNIFLNLIETIRLLNIKCRILSIGSSEEYGNVSSNDLPLKEEHTLQPVSPYGVARVSQEMLSKVYVDSYGMDIVMTRSFNHIGSYQKDIFVIPSFVKQLIALSKNNSEVKELTTGDTSIIRDFVDVRDVVRAYYLLFKQGVKGHLYNICTSKGTSLDEAIQIIASQLKIKVTHRIDTSLVRPNDNRVIIGSNEKIKQDTSWEPTISFEESLREVVEYYKKEPVG